MQPKNAESPKAFIFSGIYILVSLLHPLNALAGTELSVPSGRQIFSRFEQFLNIPMPRFVMVSGREIYVSPVQPSNAKELIVLMVPGKLTLFSFVQL